MSKDIHDSKRLKELQELPLQRKVGYTIAKIVEWYTKNNGKVYVAFSGGKDSTVLLYICRSLYPDIPAVFCDTGLEFPEIKQFVSTFDNVIITKPEMNFKDVVFKYGYPVISKIVSDSVAMARSKPDGYYASKFDANSPASKKNNGRYCVAKHSHFLTCDFKIHAICCNKLKKQPSKKYEKETGNVPIIGMMASESMERKRQWIKNGCNGFDKARPTSNPLSFWKTQDILEYITLKNIKICSVYGDIVNNSGKFSTTGMERTGCIFCLFGVNKKNIDIKFYYLQKKHPKLYSYCMNGGEYFEDGYFKPNKNGLGLSHVIEYLKKTF